MTAIASSSAIGTSGESTLVPCHSNNLDINDTASIVCHLNYIQLSTMI